MKRFIKSMCCLLCLPQSFAVLAANSDYQTIPNAEWRTAENVIDFQPFSESVEFHLEKEKNGFSGKLINLNRHVNIWHVIRLESATGKRRLRYFNLENSLPQSQSLGMSREGALLIKSGQGEAEPCYLFGETEDAHNLLKIGKSNPYVPLCGGKIVLRTQQNGRNRIKWSGKADGASMPWDQTIDKEQPQSATESQPKQAAEAIAPHDAKVSHQANIARHHTAFKLADNSGRSLTAGQWYKAQNYQGVFVSLMKPKFIEREILRSFRKRVNPLRGSEGNTVVVSVAMDLSKYSVGWNNGTKHPGVGWSRRAYGVKRIPRKGPDGFNSLKPQLTFPGVVNPVLLPKVVGTFAGGFQRKDSAFKRGPLRSFNKAHHYGLMEKGVLMSTLVPNLATLVTYTNGDVDIKVWTKEDNEKLHLVRDARQNGVPLIENGEPSPLVRQWVPGNWFGSAKAELKTPRTSACILEREGNRYLMVSFHASHTPNALAKVLQSYGCKNGMQFDMNGLILAYAAFFQRSEKGGFDIEHIYAPMKSEDARANGFRAPRSIVTPNYKDFFYVMEK